MQLKQIFKKEYNLHMNIYIHVCVCVCVRERERERERERDSEAHKHFYTSECSVLLCEARTYFLRPFDLRLRDFRCVVWWPVQEANQGLDTHRLCAEYEEMSEPV
jgi:hypothetical protein